MIALDTHLMVYAHRADTPAHDAALRLLQQLAESSEPWAIPWPCVHEFISVVTGPAFGKAATPLEVALEAARQLLAHPRCIVLSETDGHFELLSALCQHANLRGGPSTMRALQPCASRIRSMSSGVATAISIASRICAYAIP